MTNEKGHAANVAQGFPNCSSQEYSQHIQDASIAAASRGLADAISHFMMVAAKFSDWSVDPVDQQNFAQAADMMLKSRRILLAISRRRDPAGATS